VNRPRGGNRHFDVFNGDADGICALQQLRLVEPRPEAILVTGVKRDIQLLERIEAVAGDSATVLDISLDTNRVPLQRLLDAGVSITYFDHHFAGEIPEHPALQAHIDPAPLRCTSLLVDQQLSGASGRWAVVGAFGDNLHDSAHERAADLGLDATALTALEQLGTLLNYNGYGEQVADLHFPPDQLYRELHPYADPLQFIAESPTFTTLAAGYAADMAHAAALEPTEVTPRWALYHLPDAAWARRISGVLGNQLARDFPQRAHALVSQRPDGDLRISLRAPLVSRRGADALCRQFPTGGGREAAAGINTLPATELPRFIAALAQAFG